DRDVVEIMRGVVPKPEPLGFGLPETKFLRSQEGSPLDSTTLRTRQSTLYLTTAGSSVTGCTAMPDQDLTPMMRQYHAMKQEVPDALLIFRLGDFYELFFEDAVTASRELEI